MNPTGSAFGIVKSVTSGDTVVLRSNDGKTELSLSLSSIIAPRLARSSGNSGSSANVESTNSGDEPMAWEAREFLRKLCIGKPVRFKVEYHVQQINRSFGWVTLVDPPTQLEGTPDHRKYQANENLCITMARSGLVRVKIPRNVESTSEKSKDLETLIELEDEAKREKRGLWSSKSDQEKRNRHVIQVIPSVDENDTTGSSNDKHILAETLVEKFKGKAVPACIEYCVTGSLFRVLLFTGAYYANATNKKKLEMVYCSLALPGLTCPRDSPHQDDTLILTEEQSEKNTQMKKLASEARRFVAMRLLHRDVKIELTGFGGSNSTMLYGEVRHPAGDISTLLLSRGLAHMVDWSAATLSSKRCKDFRTAQSTAKRSKQNFWGLKTTEDKDDWTVSPTTDTLTKPWKSFEYIGVVSQVLSGDVLLIGVEAEFKSNESTKANNGAAVATTKDSIEVSSNDDLNKDTMNNKTCDTPFHWMLPTIDTSSKKVPSNKAVRQSTVHLAVNRQMCSRKCYLSSVTAPRKRRGESSTTNTTAMHTTAPFERESKEYLRKKLVGQRVHVKVDYLRRVNRQGDTTTTSQATSSSTSKKTEYLEFGTVHTVKGSSNGPFTYNPRFPPKLGVNVGLLVVDAGLANVTQHRASDEHRSPAYDALLQAEVNAKKKKRGMFSVGSGGKSRRQKGRNGASTGTSMLSSTTNTTTLAPIRDLTRGENSQARRFVESFILNSRSGGSGPSTRLKGTIVHIFSTTKYKIHFPEHNCLLNVILRGVTGPPRNDDFGVSEVALRFVRDRFTQRDVTISVYHCDKGGNIIGHIASPYVDAYVNKGGDNSTSRTVLESASSSVYSNNTNNNHHLPAVRDVGLVLLSLGLVRLRETSELADDPNYRSANDGAAKLGLNIWKIVKAEEDAAAAAALAVNGENGSTDEKNGNTGSGGNLSFNVKVSEVVNANCFWVHLLNNTNSSQSSSSRGINDNCNPYAMLTGTQAPAPPPPSDTKTSSSSTFIASEVLHQRYHLGSSQDGEQKNEFIDWTKASWSSPEISSYGSLNEKLQCGEWFARTYSYKKNFGCDNKTTATSTDDVYFRMRLVEKRGNSGWLVSWVDYGNTEFLSAKTIEKDLESNRILPFVSGRQSQAPPQVALATLAYIRCPQSIDDDTGNDAAWTFNNLVWGQGKTLRAEPKLEWIDSHLRNIGKELEVITDYFKVGASSEQGKLMECLSRKKELGWPVPLSLWVSADAGDSATKATTTKDEVKSSLSGLSVAKELVKKGLCRLSKGKRRGRRRAHDLKNANEEVENLKVCQDEARSGRKGLWLYGDNDTDDEM
eukprot:g2834.t1